MENKYCKDCCEKYEDCNGKCGQYEYCDDCGGKCDGVHSIPKPEMHQVDLLVKVLLSQKKEILEKVLTKVQNILNEMKKD